MWGTAEQVRTIRGMIMMGVDELFFGFRSTIRHTVLGQISEESGHLQAVALTRDQDGHNQAEYIRVLSEHPVKEHKDIFAGGRLFGETPVTRCMYLNF